MPLHYDMNNWDFNTITDDKINKLLSTRARLLFFLFPSFISRYETNESLEMQ